VAAAELLKQLQLAVGAELGKGLGEQQLLQQCNEAAAERYQQLGDAAGAARQRLQELHQQQEEELAPQLRLLTELEGQASCVGVTHCLSFLQRYAAHGCPPKASCSCSQLFKY
jgi:hypothetical protein